MFRKLLDAATTTGVRTGITWLGGAPIVFTDNLGTGTARMEMSPNGSAWESAPLYSSTGIVTNTTADGAYHAAPIPCGWQVRGVLITASTTGATMWVGN